MRGRREKAFRNLLIKNQKLNICYGHDHINPQVRIQPSTTKKSSDRKDFYNLQHDIKTQLFTLATLLHLTSLMGPFVGEGNPSWCILYSWWPSQHFTVFYIHSARQKPLGRHRIWRYIYFLIKQIFFLKLAFKAKFCFCIKLWPRNACNIRD